MAALGTQHTMVLDEEGLMYSVTSAARLPMCASAWDGCGINTTHIEQLYIASLLPVPCDSAHEFVMGVLGKYRPKETAGRHTIPIGPRRGKGAQMVPSGNMIILRESQPDVLVWNQAWPRIQQ